MTNTLENFAQEHLCIFLEQLLFGNNSLTKKAAANVLFGAKQKTIIFGKNHHKFQWVGKYKLW